MVCQRRGGRGPAGCNECSVPGREFGTSILPPATATAGRKRCSASSWEGKREQVFLASKSHVDDLTEAAVLAEVDGSLKVRADFIDLDDIHWPRARDMRPVMEGLETARAQGKIGAIGVSNFNVAQMEQVSEVGRIAVHQMGYNLLWRYAEVEALPYCRDHDIAVVAYSPLGHGILTG